MNKIVFYIPLLFASSIFLVHLIPAEATPPCTIHGPTDVWMSYDDIYTGKVVSISNQTDNTKDDPELNDWQKRADVKIDFELERLLKGNPQTSWHYTVPLESYCPGDFCVSGADHFLIGTEIFYIDNYNGNGYPFNGACGIGTATAQYYQGFFDYFEEIYGFSVPKSPHSLGEKTTCNNNEHLLVLRDNGKRACVTEKTSHKMNWNEITNVGIQFQNNTNVDVTYDYPLSSEINQIKNDSQSQIYGFDSKVILSKLPKVGETAEITMTYTNLEENSQPYEEDKIQFIISSNFRFVDIDYEDISSFHPRYGSYSEEFQSIKQHHENTFSVTIEAVAEGHGSIGVGGRGAYHSFEVFVDEDKTLLVEDYYKIHYPIPETQIFTKQTELILKPEPVIIPPTQYLPSCSEPCTDKTHFEYGYKVLYENNTTKTKFDYQLSEKITNDYSDKQRTSNAVNVIDNYNITITNLPTINETSEITVSLTVADYDLPPHLFPSNPYMFIEISDSLAFVGIPTDEIKNDSWPYKKQFVYPIFNHSLEQNYTETLFATIKALKTGTGEISVYVGEYIQHIENKDVRTVNYKMVIGENETLLLDDYFKKHLSN